MHWQAGYLLHSMGEYPRAIDSFRASIEAQRLFERALEFDPYYLPALQVRELMKQHGLKGL